MLKKFHPNLTCSPSASKFSESEAGQRDSIVNELLKKGAAAIAEKDHDIKAFTAQKQFDFAEKYQGSPLAGLPVGVKDIIDTCDMPTQHGSAIYEGHQPKADSSVVSLVRRAGGQIKHKTVTTEFAFLTPNKTHNPYSLNHTPGGSSSGSAACVAAGMLPFAIGTQTGGSVVRPASYCGVVGFKPSFDSLPTVGTKTFSWSLDTLGLFAPSVADTQLLWSTLMQTSAPFQAESKPLKIGIAKTQLWQETSEDVKTAIESAASAWRSAGHGLVDIEWDDSFSHAFDAHKTIHDYECCRALAWEMDNHGALISQMLMETLEAGLKVTRENYVAAQAVAADARVKFAKAQASVDVVLTPSASGSAPETLNSTGTSIFNRFLTLMGVPCINLPGYINEHGLPVGVQLVGRSGADDQLLASANQLWSEL